MTQNTKYISVKHRDGGEDNQHIGTIALTLDDDDFKTRFHAMLMEHFDAEEIDISDYSVSALRDRVSFSLRVFDLEAEIYADGEGYTATLDLSPTWIY